MGAEGNPATDGPAFGEFCPYIHTANDTMTLDDEFGYFSVDVSLVFRWKRAESLLVANKRMCSTWPDLRNWHWPLQLSKPSEFETKMGIFV